MIKRGLWIIVAVLLCSGSAQASGPVWQVVGKGTVLYLGGTIHLMRESDLPLPRAFEYAYARADHLVFETDLARMASPETVRAFMAQGFYTKGTRLFDKLSPTTMKRLTTYCQRTGIPISGLANMKPYMLLISLLGAELQRIGADRPGVDQRLFQRAVTDQKAVDGLESVTDQLAFMAAMGDGNEDRFVAHLLDDLDDTQRLIDQLLNTWRTADEPGLIKLFIHPLKTDFPNLHASLLVDRNRQWLPKIEAYANTPATELILVGVAHLVGDDGLLARLVQKGYRVARVAP